MELSNVTARWSVRKVKDGSEPMEEVLNNELCTKWNDNEIITLSS